MSESMLDLTTDTLFDGAVTCFQHAQGYRFSVDAILVSQFLEPKKGEVIVDLGAGCGVIGLILMYRWGESVKELIAYEYQSQLIKLIEKNFSYNRFTSNTRCVQGSVQTIVSSVGPEFCSLVICNPPYYPPGSGRKSSNEESCIARHQIQATLDDFTQGASGVVKNGGSAVFIYPAERIVELLVSLDRARLTVKKLQTVYSYPGCEKGRLVLVHCVKNGGQECNVMEPFYIYAYRNGPYSNEMQELYAP